MSVDDVDVFGREVDIARYAKFPRRIIRALGGHCANADPWQLEHLLALRDELDQAIEVAVAGLRDAGFSWTEIARPLGITRQGARQVYGQPTARAGRTTRIATTPGCRTRDSA